MPPGFPKPPNVPKKQKELCSKKYKKSAWGAALKSTGILAGFVYGVAFVSTHIAFNEERIYPTEHSITKADGAFSYTKFNRDLLNNSERVTKAIVPFKFTTYYDDEGADGRDGSDGIVDRISFHTALPRGLHGMVYRDNKRFKADFEKGDRILAKAKKRFAPYFKE